MRRRLEGFDRRDDVEQPDEDVLVHDIFVQLDAVHDERVERRDSRWWPPGSDPGNLEQLVRDRLARGVLRLPPKRDLTR